jgi:hypothetical protein
MRAFRHDLRRKIGMKSREQEEFEKERRADRTSSAVGGRK